MRYFIALLCFISFPVLAATPDPTWVYEITGTTTLRWTPPTENVDGTPTSGIASYNIFFGTDSGTYTEQISVLDGAAQNWGFSWPVSDGSQTNWFFAMTAIDVEGDESAISNEVQKIATITIIDTRPSMPPVLNEVEMDWNCVVRDINGDVVPNVSCAITVTDG